MKFKYEKTVSIRNFEKEFDSLTKSIKKIRLPSSFSEFIFYTISELFINIKEHAQVNKGLIVLHIKNDQCFIKIRDKGIGLKQSYLKKKIVVKDDLSAVEFALSGLSTKSSQERGFGLYSIKKLAETLRGSLIITTGYIKVLVQKNRIRFQSLPQKFSGTMIEVKTPIKKFNFYKAII